VRKLGIIVSFINRKGGVGKTTTAVNLGGYIAKELDKKVLIIDLDAQASASSWLMTQDRYINDVVKSKDNPKNTSYQIFRDAIFNENYFNENISIKKAVVRDENGRILIPKLDLIAADIKLDNVEREIVNYNDLKTAILLECLLNNKIKIKYDYILIDCPPNMGTTAQNALFASDIYIIPIIADPLSFQGFPELINTAEETLKIAEKRRDDHKKPICGGLILSHIRKTKACEKTIEDIRNLLFMFKNEGKLDKKTDIFLSKITYKTAIPDCQGQGAILATSKKRSDSQGEFESLAREFHDKFKHLL